MKEDPARDALNYRGCVDLVDPHNGIGQLSIQDMTETPCSVMEQGAAAAVEINNLRNVIDDIEKALLVGDVATAQGYISVHRAIARTADERRAQRIIAYHEATSPA